MRLLEQALENIKPTSEEVKELTERAKRLIFKIKSVLEEEVVLGGSGVKGTWLKGEHDIDIFVMFDYDRYSNRSNLISDLLEIKLKKIFRDLERFHGSRDYFRISEGGFIFEIIPILKIKKSSEAKNITDVSPLHSKWINKKIKEKGRKSLGDEIRLLKQFCKSARVYGAESYIKGLSGYVCEILTVYYGSFLRVIRNAVKWKDKVVIDVEGYYNGKNVIKELSFSKTYSPLIVIDPVQKERNASASISKEKFSLFRSRCKEFLKKPDLSFFLEKEITINDIKKIAGRRKFIILSVLPLKGKDDIIGCKLLRVFEYINKNLLRNDFEMVESNWYWNRENAIYYFIFKKYGLSEFRKHQGPLIRLSEHVERFKQDHKKTFVAGNRICAYVNREFTKPGKLVESVIKENYIKERVRSIELR
jgi:tRNA nucleotidyltransferase (CCA-adding enzyme)